MLRQPVEELRFPGGERFARGFGHGDRTEQLALMSHRGDPVGIDRRELVALDRERTRRVRLTGHEAASVQPVPQPEPDVGASRAGSLGDHARDPWQDVVARVGLADALPEAGEHLVRRRPLAVHQPVREPVGAVAHRLERDRDERRRGDPKEQRVG